MIRMTVGELPARWRASGDFFPPPRGGALRAPRAGSCPTVILIILIILVIILLAFQAC